MILERYFSNFRDSLTIRRYNKKYKKNTAQRILVRWLLGKEEIYEDEGEIIYKNIITVKLNKNAKNKVQVDKNIFLNMLRNEKKFLVDTSLYHLHSNKGKKSLIIQLQHSLSIIRDFLFDTNFIIVGNLNIDFLGNNMVYLFKNLEEFPLEKYKAIILDSEGEIVLNESLIKKYDLFLIGGIVDIGLEWHGATKYLFKDLNLSRAKIELEGSTIGVPDRINLLIKILLETSYLNIPLKEAIVKNQGKRDIIRRLWYEIKKYSKNKSIKEEDLYKILENVNLSKEKLMEFLYKNNIKII